MELFVFGDSITWGAFDEDLGWANRLKKHYFSEFLINKNDYVKTYVLGVSGNTSGDIVQRIEKEITNRKSDQNCTTLVAIGINDSQFNLGTNINKVSLVQFQKNIATITKIVKKITPNLIFVGLTSINESLVNPIPWNPQFAYSQNHINDYDRTLENFCNSNKIKFISLKKLLDTDDLEDGVHPNTMGHTKIFKEILKHID